MSSVDDAYAAVAGRVAVEVIAALDGDESTLCSSIHCHRTRRCDARTGRKSRRRPRDHDGRVRSAPPPHACAPPSPLSRGFYLLSNADRAHKVTGSIRVTLSSCVTLCSVEGALSPDSDEDTEG